MSMPLDYINALYNMAVERQKAEMKQQEEEKAKAEAEGREYTPGMTSAQAMALESELEGALS